DSIADGSVAKYIANGVRGVTSNPAIFEKAIDGSMRYDHDIVALRNEGATVDDAYWSLVMADIQSAADLFTALHQESEGNDGFVSVEIDPRLADETPAQIDAGKSMF